MDYWAYIYAAGMIAAGLLYAAAEISPVLRDNEHETTNEEENNNGHETGV